MKKLVSLWMVFLLSFVMFYTEEAQAANFSDVKLYQDEINYLTSKSVINGYPNGTFGPDRNLTRLQAVQMILREKKITDFTAPDPKLDDMKAGDYGYEEVAKAIELGFISGKPLSNGNKYFDPAAPLTRGQMAKILATSYNLKKTKDVHFVDVPSTNGFKDYISILATENITTGYGNGTFQPATTLTRAHFAVFMARLLDSKFKPEPIKAMQVHFLNVGQGDSTLIQTPDGANILIDAGTAASGQHIINFLKAKGVTKLDVVIATHPHADHIGSMTTVLNAFPVGKFVDSGKVHTTAVYTNLITTIKNKNIPFELATVGKVYNFDNGFTLKVMDVNASSANINDASVSVKGTYKNTSVLLTGDAEAAAESRMVARGGLKSTLFKAGHHGSNTSNGVSFLNQVKPEHTVLSYGKNNSYKHPHSQVINRLKAVNSKVYSTEQSGNITFILDGISVKTAATPFTGKGNDSSGVVEEDRPKPPTGNAGDGSYVVPGAPSMFANCTEMKKVYPNGVKRGHPAYAKKHDRDNDGWACE